MFSIEKKAEEFLKKSYEGGFDKGIMDIWESFKTQSPSVSMLLDLVDELEEAKFELDAAAKEDQALRGEQVCVTSLYEKMGSSMLAIHHRSLSLWKLCLIHWLIPKSHASLQHHCIREHC